MTRIDRHDLYIHCLRLAKEILRRGNNKNQQIYINVGDQKHWETELLRPYRPDLERGAAAIANIGLKHDGIIVGEPQELLGYNQEAQFWNPNWDWRRYRHEPVEGEAFYPLSDLDAQVDYVAFLSGISLSKSFTSNKTRFSVWGQMFDVAVALIEANREQELKFRLIHHDGWGTYYFEFYDDRYDCLFAISEEGHIAGLGVLFEDNTDAGTIIRDYNLRTDLVSGRPLRECKSQLKNLYLLLRKSAD